MVSLTHEPTLTHAEKIQSDTTVRKPTDTSFFREATRKKELKCQSPKESQMCPFLRQTAHVSFLNFQICPFVFDRTGRQRGGREVRRDKFTINETHRPPHSLTHSLTLSPTRKVSIPSPLDGGHLLFVSTPRRLKLIVFPFKSCHHALTPC